MNELVKLAQLINKRNQTEAEITALIGRPAQIGHIGEYIASKIFGISLQESASHKGSDGFFLSGKLRNKSVNIKWFAKLEWSLDINSESLPDYYLALTGPVNKKTNSRGEVRPWCIERAYLFDAAVLIEKLRLRKIKIGTATSVNKKLWDDAEIFPNQNNLELMLTEPQRNQIALFNQQDI